MSRLNLILKPTASCNAKCVYCSAFKDDTSKATMSEETLNRLFQQVAELGEQSVIENVLFTWHGGEPLLMPDEFYYKVLELQTTHLSNVSGLRFENTIQTNLMSLTSDRMDMLLRLLTSSDGKVNSVGTSYDPIEGVRIAKSGSYESKWWRGVDLLRDAGINFGIVYVAHKKSLESVDDVYTFLHDRLPDATVRFNPCYFEGRARQAGFVLERLSSKEWGKFLVAMHRRWVADEKELRLNPLQELENYHLNGDFHLVCDHSGTCSRGYFGIDVDGTIYPCGRGIDRGDVALGNLHKNRLLDVMQQPDLRSLMNRSLFLQELECEGCKWWRYCHGGCLMDAVMYSDTPFTRTHWCEGRKLFFNTVFSEPAGHATNPARPDRTIHINAESRPASIPDGPIYLYAASTSGLLSGLDDFGKRLQGVVWSGPVPINRLDESNFHDPLVIESQDFDTAMDNVEFLARPNVLTRVPICENYVNNVKELALREIVIDVLPAMRELNEGQVIDIIKFYLHHEALSVPIEPFHHLLFNMQRRRPISLWDLYRINPERTVYVDGQGRVSYSREFSDIKEFIGKLDGVSITFEKHPTQSRHREFLSSIATLGSDCAQCPVFFVCRGCGRFLTADCGVWKLTLSFLLDSVQQMDAAWRAQRQPQQTLPDWVLESPTYDSADK